jgi:hypothetical protein
MAPSSDYKKAYDTAKQELADLLYQQERIEKRLVIVRKSLQTFAELCANEGIEIEPSIEAAILLEDSTLADEIRNILAANYTLFFRANAIKDQIERLGHDLSEYKNPQSTIQMILKRMIESGEVEEKRDAEGKAIYAMAPSKWLALSNQWVERSKAEKLPPDHPLNKLKAKRPELEMARDRFIEAHKAKEARDKAKRD